MEGSKPTDRLAGESARAYEARGLYLRMGPGRSLAKVGQKLGKNTGQIEKWSAKFGWVESAQNHDDATAADLARSSLNARLHAEKAEVEKWQKRIDAHADQLYTPFLIAMNDLVSASKAAAAANELVPHDRQESMIRSVVRASPLADAAIDLASQRLSALRAVGGSFVKPTGRTLAIMRAMDDVTEQGPASDLDHARRLAALKAHVDFDAEPEPTG